MRLVLAQLNFTVGAFEANFAKISAAVAQAKAELIEALPSGGVAIVPADVIELAPYLRNAAVFEKTRARKRAEGSSAPSTVIGIVFDAEPPLPSVTVNFALKVPAVV